MTQERRRYFRINDTLALGYELLDEAEDDADTKSIDVLDLMSAQDAQIEQLLLQVADQSPAVAALVRALNQKLERVVAQLVADSRMVDQLAKRVKEVSISACGIGFVADREVPEGSRVALELVLEPDQFVIKTKGFVVAVDAYERGFYWRVNFYDMPASHQERLIQHIVQRQSVQLKYGRGSR